MSFYYIKYATDKNAIVDIIREKSISARVYRFFIIAITPATTIEINANAPNRKLVNNPDNNKVSSMYNTISTTIVI